MLFSRSLSIPLSQTGLVWLVKPRFFSHLKTRNVVRTPKRQLPSDEAPTLKRGSYWEMIKGLIEQLPPLNTTIVPPINVASTFVLIGILTGGYMFMFPPKDLMYKYWKWYIEKNMPIGRLFILCLGFGYGIIGGYWYSTKIYIPFKRIFQQSIYDEKRVQLLTNYIKNNFINWRDILKHFTIGFTKCTILGNLGIFSIMTISYMYTGHIFENEFLDDKLIEYIITNQNPNINMNELNWMDYRSNYYFLKEGNIKRDRNDKRLSYSIALALQGTYAIEIPFLISMSTALILNLLRLRYHCIKTCQLLLLTKKINYNKFFFSNFLNLRHAIKTFMNKSITFNTKYLFKSITLFN
ncbi:hypothetical protein RFI_29064 [Reticulomyxa filosa]|uniref:Transmembrane protein n=1 Tax=Reticulomyxa filosa TaxID=46433 RepID=X6M3Y7_RETFI|nr:hypothetical protein RFI_29064 [Reticulomyxa filosa]|eukprot:ETO08326.1 hypothetical protein RFI_29064 [Reticulomyxa filosa]